MIPKVIYVTRRDAEIMGDNLGRNRGGAIGDVVIYEDCRGDEVGFVRADLVPTKEKETCVWAAAAPSEIYLYHSSCGRSFISDPFEYCPFCGGVVTLKSGKE